ncbi:X-ray repair cross-complementing protein 5-like [Saccoglossus kowalevskii]|uniref:X-ray repair cross-complementing protein 5-like n=1 Tax=Saccoglossus kowalevskii TaxID=10224 RepID=A0ABM0M3N4_SACKO|nr:PREDICTED: X-ray repair cross-complementing protein 5-like [Saccoglossus kowalevskii]
MQQRVTQLVMDSFGTQFYDKAMDCLKTLRKESAKLDEPEIFNRFLKRLKETLVEKMRTNFWDRIVTESITLIDSSQSSESRVTKEEAMKFLKGEEKKVEVPEIKNDDDADDLLEMME